MTTSSVSRHSLAWFLAGTLLDRWAVFSTGPLIGLYLRYISDNLHSVSALAVGLISVAFNFFGLVSAPIMGSLSDRFGKKGFLLIECAMGAVATFVYPLTTSVFVIFLLQAFEGVRSGTAPVSLSYMSDATSKTMSIRGRAIALFEIVNFIGLGIGVVLGGILWDIWHENAFRITTLVYVFGFAVFAFKIQEIRPSPRTISKSGMIMALQTVVSQRRLIASAVSWFLINGTIAIWSTQGTFQMTGQTKDPSQKLIGLLSGTGISGLYLIAIPLALISIYFWGGLMYRLSKRVIMITAVCAVLCFWILLLALNHFSGTTIDLNSFMGVGLMLGLVLCLLIGVGIIPAMLTYIADITDVFVAARGAIMGLYWLFVGVGRLFGSWLGSVAAQIGQIDGMIALSLLFTLVTVGAILAATSGLGNMKYAPRGKFADREDAPPSSPMEESRWD